MDLWLASSQASPQSPDDLVISGPSIWSLGCGQAMRLPTIPVQLGQLRVSQDTGPQCSHWDSTWQTGTTVFLRGKGLGFLLSDNICGFGELLTSLSLQVSTSHLLICGASGLRAQNPPGLDLRLGLWEMPEAPGHGTGQATQPYMHAPVATLLLPGLSLSQPRPLSECCVPSLLPSPGACPCPDALSLGKDRQVGPLVGPSLSAQCPKRCCVYSLVS